VNQKFFEIKYINERKHSRVKNMKLTIIAKIRETCTRFLQPMRSECISCHVLGNVDVMLRFMHAIGLLKLAELVPVHACTQQIILVFVCGMYPL